MNRVLIISIIAAFLIGSAFILIQSEKTNEEAVDQPPDTIEWALNKTAIEACTCPMFCQCYFNTEPAAHSHEHGEEAHYCKFNVAWKVNSGFYGDTDLSDVTYWIAGDLGDGWDDGTMDWAALHFDPSVTEAQREGIIAILGPLYPVEWHSFTIKEDKTIEWRGGNKESVALLDNGNAAELRLKHPPTAMSEEPAVLTNIHFWGAPRHDGFVLMPNEVQAYRTGDNAFESRESNGFMITIDINSSDI